MKKSRIIYFLLLIFLMGFQQAYAVESSQMSLKQVADQFSRHMDNHDYMAAVDAASQAVEIAPDNCFSYYMLALAYYQIKDYSNAIEYYNRTLLFVDENTVGRYSVDCFGDGDIGYYQLMKIIYNELADCYVYSDMPEMAMFYNKLNVLLNFRYGNFIIPANDSLEKALLYYLSSGRYVEGFQYAQSILYLIPDGNKAWDICRAAVYAAIGDFYWNIGGYESKAKSAYITSAGLGHIGARNVCINNGWAF